MAGVALGLRNRLARHWFAKRPPYRFSAHQRARHGFCHGGGENLQTLTRFPEQLFRLAIEANHK